MFQYQFKIRFLIILLSCTILAPLQPKIDHLTFLKSFLISNSNDDSSYSRSNIFSRHLQDRSSHEKNQAASNFNEDNHAVENKYSRRSGSIDQVIKNLKGRIVHGNSQSFLKKNYNIVFNQSTNEKRLQGENREQNYGNKQALDSGPEDGADNEELYSEQIKDNMTDNYRDDKNMKDYPDNKEYLNTDNYSRKYINDSQDYFSKGHQDDKNDYNDMELLNKSDHSHIETAQSSNKIPNPDENYSMERNGKEHTKKLTNIMNNFDDNILNSFLQKTDSTELSQNRKNESNDEEDNSDTHEDQIDNENDDKDDNKNEEIQNYNDVNQNDHKDNEESEELEETNDENEKNMNGLKKYEDDDDDVHDKESSSDQNDENESNNEGLSNHSVGDSEEQHNTDDTDQKDIIESVKENHGKQPEGSDLHKKNSEENQSDNEKHDKENKEDQKDNEANKINNKEDKKDNIAKQIDNKEPVGNNINSIEEHQTDNDKHDKNNEEFENFSREKQKDSDVHKMDNKENFNHHEDNDQNNQEDQEINEGNEIDNLDTSSNNIKDSSEEDQKDNGKDEEEDKKSQNDNDEKQNDSDSHKMDDKGIHNNHENHDNDSGKDQEDNEQKGINSEETFSGNAKISEGHQNNNKIDKNEKGSDEDHNNIETRNDDSHSDKNGRNIKNDENMEKKKREDNANQDSNIQFSDLNKNTEKNEFGAGRLIDQIVENKLDNISRRNIESSQGTISHGINNETQSLSSNNLKNLKVSDTLSGYPGEFSHDDVSDSNIRVQSINDKNKVSNKNLDVIDTSHDNHAERMGKEISKKYDVKNLGENRIFSISDREKVENSIDLTKNKDIGSNNSPFNDGMDRNGAMDYRRSDDSKDFETKIITKEKDKESELSETTGSAAISKNANLDELNVVQKSNKNQNYSSGRSADGIQENGSKMYQIDTLQQNSIDNALEINFDVKKLIERQKILKKREVKIKRSSIAYLSLLENYTKQLQSAAKFVKTKIKMVNHWLIKLKAHSDNIYSHYLNETDYKVFPITQLHQYSVTSDRRISGTDIGDEVDFSCSLDCDPDMCDEKTDGDLHCFKYEFKNNFLGRKLCSSFQDVENILCPPNYHKCALAFPEKGSVSHLFESNEKSRLPQPLLIRGFNMQRCMRLLTVRMTISCEPENLFNAIDESRRLSNSDTIVGEVIEHGILFQGLEVYEYGEYKLCMVQYHNNKAGSTSLNKTNLIGSGEIGKLIVFKQMSPE